MGSYEDADFIKSMFTSRHWPRCRMAEAGVNAVRSDISRTVEVVDAICIICGQAPETDLHRCWQCPVIDSRQACPPATATALGHPSWWLRGTPPPLSFTQVTPEDHGCQYRITTARTSLRQD